MTMMMMASSGHNKNEDESCSDVHSNTHVPNVPQQPGQKNTIPQQKQTDVLQVPSEMLNTKPPSEFLSSSSSSSSSSSINGAVSDMFWINIKTQNQYNTIIIYHLVVIPITTHNGKVLLRGWHQKSRVTIMDLKQTCIPLVLSQSC